MTRPTHQLGTDLLYNRGAQPAAFDKNICGLAHVI